MHIRQITTIHKVTKVSASAQAMFDRPREVYFLSIEAANNYVSDHPELGLVITQEKAFERGYDSVNEGHKELLAYNYYLFRPAEIERTKNKDLQKSHNAWGCVLRDGVKHFIQFDSAVERAIKENKGSVLILSRNGHTYVSGLKKHYQIEHYGIHSENAMGMMSCLYVETGSVKAKQIEVRSFIHENNMIRVNTSVPKKRLVKEKQSGISPNPDS